MASLDRFPLHYLAAFRAAAQTENLRAAAESLYLTHSAVSQQIRGLEAQLGFEVFTRQGRRLVLNPAGRPYSVPSPGCSPNCRPASSPPPRHTAAPRRRCA